MQDRRGEDPDDTEGASDVSSECPSEGINGGTLIFYLFPFHERTQIEQENEMRQIMTTPGITTLRIHGFESGPNWELLHSFILENSIEEIQRTLGTVLRHIRCSGSHILRYTLDPFVMRIMINCFEGQFLLSSDNTVREWYIREN